MKRAIRAWLRETHGTGIELVRHFLSRFFDNDMVTTAGDWLRLGLGAGALVPLLWPIMWLAWQIKYITLVQHPRPDLYRLAIRDDQLWLIALAMCATAALVAMQWSSLFPSRRDLLAIASLPVRSGEVFLAKFSTLLVVFAAFILAVVLVPACLFAAITEGRWQENPSLFVNAGALAISSIAACAFVFFSAVAVQGLLLDLLPGKLFARISVYAQAALFTVSVGALPFLSRQPASSAWWPPQWFLHLWAALIGASDGNARPALLASAVAPVGAVFLYLVSYRRYPRLLLEESGAHGQGSSHGAAARLAGRLLDRWIRRPGEQAMFVFIWKTLTHSRSHRLVLLAYIGIALGWIARPQDTGGFASLLVVMAPLAIAAFIVCALRYLFSLPVELRAHWIFQITEQDGRAAWLSAVERFVVWCGIAPVFVIALPAAIAVLGPLRGMGTYLLAWLLTLILFESLFVSWHKAPFTCSYLPGKRPFVITAIPFLVALVMLAPASELLLYGSSRPAPFVVMLALELGLWRRTRKLRREAWGTVVLLYEDVFDPEVTKLGIDLNLATIRRADSQ